jgi:hypothetical protein
MNIFEELIIDQLKVLKRIHGKFGRQQQALTSATVIPHIRRQPSRHEPASVSQAYTPAANDRPVHAAFRKGFSFNINSQLRFQEEDRVFILNYSQRFDPLLFCCYIDIPDAKIDGLHGATLHRGQRQYVAWPQPFASDRRRLVDARGRSVCQVIAMRLASASDVAESATSRLLPLLHPGLYIYNQPTAAEHCGLAENTAKPTTHVLALPQTFRGRDLRTTLTNRKTQLRSNSNCV